MSFLSRFLQTVTTPALSRLASIGRQAEQDKEEPGRLPRPDEVLHCFGEPMSARLAKGLDYLEMFGAPGALRTRPATAGARDGRWTFNTYANSGGSRDYWLFVPDRGRPVTALVMMLHGCSQTAADFAAGTQMNARAHEANVAVVYPEQPRTANMSRCWNWFDPANQERDGAEPGLLAGLAAMLVGELGVPAGSVFAAGLSAGGAMAAILGVTYPDVFAAVGIHSGLPYRAAHDFHSALAAMRDGLGDTIQSNMAPKPRQLPVIVFHGDADNVVNPSNGEEIAARQSGLVLSHSEGRDNGRAYRRTIGRDRAGQVRLELWMIGGASHAWSGGSRDGSHTDPTGPDASAEMLRFFLEGQPSSGATGLPHH